MPPNAPAPVPTASLAASALTDAAAGHATLRSATSLADRLAFLSGFLRDPSGVGSVAPSSHRLERRIVRLARIKEARAVVELGPGTGGTTRALLAALAPQARLLALELDAPFHARLCQQIKDHRCVIEHNSAEYLAELLARRQLPAPDAIVSGIPFSTMPREVSARIAAVVAAVLAPGGRFVAYQVRPHVAQFTRPHLGSPHTEWELWNIPPMRVMTWIKPVAATGS